LTIFLIGGLIKSCVNIISIRYEGRIDPTEREQEARLALEALPPDGVPLDVAGKSRENSIESFPGLSVK